MPISPAAIRRLQPQLQSFLQEYLDWVAETERRGESREESFYPCLLDLFRVYAGHRGRRDLQVTQLPRKRRDCLLDFQIRRGERIGGHVEGKGPVSNLGLMAESAQVKRDRLAFPNLLLTNFCQVQLYRADLLAA